MGDIATTIDIIIVIERVTAIKIAVIIAACKPVIVSTLTVVDIFETFLAKFIVSFVKSGLINSGENFLRY